MILATAPSFHEMLRLIREYFEGGNRAIPRIKWSHLLCMCVHMRVGVSLRERVRKMAKSPKNLKTYTTVCVYLSSKCSFKEFFLMITISRIFFSNFSCLSVG